MTPTQRTMRELRRVGTKCAVVEKWNAFAPRPGGPPGIRQDLFGIIDVITLDPVRGVVGIQCCAGSGYATHYRKIIEEHTQDFYDWITTPGTAFELWAWRKVKVVKGGKAEIWSPRIRPITIDDLSAHNEAPNADL